MNSHIYVEYIYKNSHIYVLNIASCVSLNDEETNRKKSVGDLLYISLSIPKKTLYIYI